MVYYLDQEMHNIYINSEFYIGSTTCFSDLQGDANASRHQHLQADSLKML
jgi:hypothetical protein